MGKAESITSSKRCDKLAQLLEASIAHYNAIGKQLVFCNESAILAFRAQIADNVAILLPYFKANSKATAAAIDIGATIHVITVGQEPAVRACVFSGSTNGLMKLIHAAEATDATSALRSLMEKTQSMLASVLNYSPKSTSKRSKHDSGIATIDSCPAKFHGNKITGPTTPAYSTPAKSRVSKIKPEGKTHHVRDKSETAFFDGATVNNQTFLETCGEPTDDGKDSGFLSRDGEIHPRRSFVLANANAPVPAEEDDAIFF